MIVTFSEYLNTLIMTFQNPPSLHLSTFLKELISIAKKKNCMIKMCITMLVDEYTDIKESSNDPVTSAGNKEDSLVKVLN
ncbi:hypothetical protein BpHYR1_018600, partial [Brachionus plicatilis]